MVIKLYRLQFCIISPSPHLTHDQAIFRQIMRGYTKNNGIKLVPTKTLMTKINFVRSFLIGLLVGEVIGTSTSSPWYNKITTCCILDKYIQICKVKAPQNIIPPMYTQKIGKFLFLFLLFIQRVEGYRKQGGSVLGHMWFIC